MSKKTRQKSSKSVVGGGVAEAQGAKAKKAASVRAKAGSPIAPKKPIKTIVKSAQAPSSGKATALKAKRPAAAKPKPVRKLAALNEGDAAPAFGLPRDGGQIVSLGDFAGRKLVIFFYPRADTPGCTLEAIAFSRLAKAFASAQTSVLGVSADPIKAQESFRDKHDLRVPLVSDETLGMLKAYGVWGEKSMYGKTFMGIVRTTVLIDEGGKILKIWRNVRVNGHADEVLAAVRTA